MKRVLIFVMLAVFAVTSAYAIGPGLVQIREGDGTPSGWVYDIVVDNTALSITGSTATIDLSGAAGGQAITLDLGDDAGDDSVDLGEIATTGDTNTIFTEPTADKLLIAVGNNWPTADSADAVAANAVTDLGIDWGAGANQVNAGDVPTDVTNFDGVLGAGDTDVQTALETIDDMTSGAGDVTGVGDCASGACLDGSSDGGSYVRVYDGDSHYGEFQVPNIAGNVTYTFPAATSTIPPDTGSANIVTVGTIATGTWQGDAIGTTYAGTDLDASNLGAVITMSDGDLVDFSGVTMSGTNDEGLVLPTWGNTTPTTDQAYITWDGTASSLKIYDGGWVTIDPTGAPTDATYITQTPDATLSAEFALNQLGDGVLASDGNGVIAVATEAQVETISGALFGASKAVTSGYIWVADGTDFESVAMSGDVTIATGGATTIGADTVALTTDTTGNYTASIADAGNTTITVVNGATEGGAVTLDAVDLNCTDCINATEIEDIYPLMAGDTVAGNMIWNGTMTLNGAVTLGAIMTVEATADEIQATAGQDIVFQLGDNAGANVIEFEDSDGVPVFYVNSDGAVTYVSTNNPYFMFNEDDASPKFAMRHFDTTTDVWQVGTTTSDPNTQFTKVSEVDASGNFNVIGSYEIDGTQIALTDLSDGESHAANHIDGGADEIDGDEIVIDYAESNYTPATTGTATHVDDLAAHLEGIDDALGASSAGTFANLTDTTIAAPAAGHIAIYDGANSWDNKAIQSPFALDSSGNLTIAAHLTVGDYNLTNVGDVALDSISADATNISIVASGGTVTVESVVFTGAALSAVSTAAMSGALTIQGAINLGTGGVVFTDDADGALTITGAGAGSDEDLTINLDDTANTIVLSSSTGVTDISLTAMNLVTTGTITGRLKWGTDVSTTPVSHDTTALHGVMYLVTAAATINLDAPADTGYGGNACYVIRDAAEAVIIDIDGSTKLNLDGTAQAVGVGVTATGAGEKICVIASTDVDGSGGDGYWIWGNTSGWASQ